MTTNESHYIRARQVMNAARKGYLPKPKTSSVTPIGTSISSDRDQIFETARENSIEVYDDQFRRNSILTRSARMRKFKFYQYKPVHDSPSSTTPKLASRWTNSESTDLNSEKSPDRPVLIPRDEVLQGKVALIASQSKELSDLDNQILELEKKISDLNTNNSVNHLDEIFELVNKKNDLLRRQMQLNIIEQEKVLEKANEELTKELRSLLSIEDCKKSPAQLERQKYLYDQSLALVNKRNELVIHMDEQEKGIEDDNRVKETVRARVISNKEKYGNSTDQNCCIQ